MLIDSYYEHVDKLFEKIRTTQRENIIAAAHEMTEAMLRNANIHIHDTGHIINSEMTSRSGGLVAPRHLRYNLVTENPGRPRPAMINKDRNQIDMAELVYNAGNICPGDLVIFGSVSGRSEQLIDLVLTVQKHGCRTVAVTSLEYSKAVKSAHPSGKRLFELADVVIDNCSPLGDGMMHVDGLEMPFIPASGLGATYVMWAVYAACAEEMLSLGHTPGIYKSSNMPGGDEYNLKMDKRWEKLGY